MPQTGPEPVGLSFPRCQRVRELYRYRISAAGGDVGHVSNLYFDDQSWTVRHLVIKTGRWRGQRVLLSPHAIERIDVPGHRLIISLPRQQVETNFQTPLAAARAAASPAPDVLHQPERALPGADSPFSSANTIRGHKIRATDGELGHVADTIVDVQDWAIRYLIIDPRSWWPGAHLLLPTEWISAIHQDDQVVDVDVSRATVRAAPRYDPGAALELDFETRYWGHFGRPTYWERPPESWWES